MNIQFLRHRDTPVIFQRFRSCWFDVIAYKWYVTDFNSFGGGKKSHVGRVVVQGIYKYSFFKNEVAQPGPSGFQPAGQSDGSSANNENIQYFMHGFKDKS